VAITTSVTRAIAVAEKAAAAATEIASKPSVTVENKPQVVVQDNSQVKTLEGQRYFEQQTVESIRKALDQNSLGLKVRIEQIAKGAVRA
jgi:hypothetical protein